MPPCPCSLCAVYGENDYAHLIIVRRLPVLVGVHVECVLFHLLQRASDGILPSSTTRFI